MYDSYLNLTMGGTAEFGVLPYHRGVSTQTRLWHTFGIVLAGMVLGAFFNFLAAFVIMGTGVYIVWSPKKNVTKMERKVFWTIMLATIGLILVDKATIAFRAGGLVVAATIVAIVVVWRR